MSRPIVSDGLYPCLCLCLGFLQITITTPLRLMILHFSQRTLTDALTFTWITSLLGIQDMISPRSPGLAYSP